MKATFGNAEHDEEIRHGVADKEAPITIFDKIGKALGIISCIVIAYGIIISL